MIVTGNTDIVEYVQAVRYRSVIHHHPTQAVHHLLNNKLILV